MIKKGQQVRIKSEFQDPGDRLYIMIAMEDQRADDPKLKVMAFIPSWSGDIGHPWKYELVQYLDPIPTISFGL